MKLFLLLNGKVVCFVIFYESDLVSIEGIDCIEVIRVVIKDVIKVILL